MYVSKVQATNLLSNQVHQSRPDNLLRHHKSRILGYKVHSHIQTGLYCTPLVLEQKLCNKGLHTKTLWLMFTYVVLFIHEYMCQHVDTSTQTLKTNHVSDIFWKKYGKCWYFCRREPSKNWWHLHVTARILDWIVISHSIHLNDLCIFLREKVIS